MRLAVLGFMIMGLVSGLSLTSMLVPLFGVTQGLSCWRMHLSAKLDSSMRVSGRPAGHVVNG